MLGVLTLVICASGADASDHVLVVLIINYGLNSLVTTMKRLLDPLA